MNLKRGFRRITLFLAIVSAVFGALLAYIMFIEPLQYWDAWPLVGVTILAGLAGAVGGYCGVWLVYKLIEWFVLGFCGIEAESEGRNNAMNLRRGFRRVMFVLAVIAATFCAGLSALIVINKHESAQSYLQWRRENPRLVLDEPLTLDQMASARKSEVTRKTSRFAEVGKRKPDIFDRIAAENEGKTKDYSIQPKKEKILTFEEIRAQGRAEAEAQLKKLEGGFWVSLSKGSLVGLCILAGLAGAGVGFGGVWLGYCVMWLFYLLIRWVVLGFCSRAQ